MLMGLCTNVEESALAHAPDCHHADLTMLARLSMALARARAFPLAA
jgi:hypothetical protein